MASFSTITFEYIKNRIILNMSKHIFLSVMETL